MKALFEKLMFDGPNSVLVRRFCMPYFDAPWHYHPEVELTYIVQGYGQRFVGDHVDLFLPGDLVLLGADLPHFWRSDDDFYQPQNGYCSESVVVQFSTAFVQQGIMTLPEAETIQALLARARYGIRFSPEVSQAIPSQLEQLPTKTGFTQLLAVLDLLYQLAADKAATVLASDGYPLAHGSTETERMKRVLEYVLTHFRSEIRTEQIASVAGMAPAAFCRYFKNRTRKTFVEYLNELRISQARKLLSQVDLSVGQVGLECGFNNSSHFHKQFKLHTGMTPLHYQTIARHK